MAALEGKRGRIEKLHIGTMGWSYGFWVSHFYPEGLKPPAFLAEYAKHFDTVELDNTFYRIPSTSATKTWREQTPEGFLFSAKFPRVITHVKMLRNCEREVDIFISRMSQLQDKLGPLLLQFPSSFGAKHFPDLREFLSTLPKGYRYAVEVRNKDWAGEKLDSLLRENGVVQVSVGQPVFEATAGFVYIRWEGDRSKVSGTLGKVEVDRTEDIGKVAAGVRNFLDQNLEVFGYFSKYYSGYPPSDAEQLLNLLQ
ncbi:MAG: DUF72 domain-containing protein [Candidatus Bathyarchaeia archaeon]